MPRSKAFEQQHRRAIRRVRHFEQRHFRHRQPKSKRQLLVNLRIAELQRLFADRCGGPQLSEDDAGLDYLKIALHHLAFTNDPAAKMLDWVRTWAPWMPVPEAKGYISEIISKPHMWTADALAHELNLSYQDRARLRIRTIGATDVNRSQRAKMQRAQKTASERERRRKAGVRPREQYEEESLSQTKPWEKEEPPVSRRTWERRRKKARCHAA